MSSATTSQRGGLADALFSTTRQKVLRLLFAEQGADYSIRDLIDRAEAGSGAVQRELARLVESGIVEVYLQGRQKRYRANPDSPIYAELSSLVAKLLGPEKQVEQALQTIGDKVELALIYGSVASQTEHANSDLDLMLVSDSLTLEDVFEALAPAEKSLSRTINPTLYTHKEFQKRLAERNPFLRKVLEGRYILLKGSINEQRSTG